MVAVKNFSRGLKAVLNGSAVEELRALRQNLDQLGQKLDHLNYDTNAVYVGNNRVLMKAIVSDAYIAFLLEADDRLLSPWFIVSGRFETELTDFFLRHLTPESHCVDVGSNFGYFTCLMARFCPKGRVFAIEPDAHVYELARDNIAINGLESIAEALHAAASDRARPITLYRRMTRSGNTSIFRADAVAAKLGEAPCVPFEVDGMRIDDLLPRLGGRVDFLKVDVEGAEPLALRGARETIVQNPDLTIVMEWSPLQIQEAGFDVPSFLSELDELGLRISRTTGEALSREDMLGSNYFTGVVLRHR